MIALPEGYRSAFGVCTLLLHNPFDPLLVLVPVDSEDYNQGGVISPRHESSLGQQLSHTLPDESVLSPSEMADLEVPSQFIAQGLLNYDCKWEGDTWYHNELLPITPGLLTIPGGLIDDGETPLQAARREVYEETGLCLDPDLFRQLENEHMFSTIIQFRKGIYYLVVVTPFVIFLNNSQLRELSLNSRLTRHQEIKMADPEELLKDPSILRPFTQALLSRAHSENLWINVFGKGLSEHVFPKFSQARENKSVLITD